MLYNNLMANFEAGEISSLIEVSDVRDGVVILRNGGLRRLILVSGINFDLKGEEEKNLIVFGFQDFLNSLQYPIQILVHSRKVNISGYLEKIKNLQVKETNEQLKNLIEDYHGFIDFLVSKNPIMSKTFVVTVPYDYVDIGGASGAAGNKILGFFGKKQPTAEKTAADNVAKFNEYTRQLDLRAEQVMSSLNRVGLRAVALNQEEVLELLYNFYNPATIEKKHESKRT